MGWEEMDNQIIYELVLPSKCDYSRVTEVLGTTEAVTELDTAAE
jgi:hypothetical protein